MHLFYAVEIESLYMHSNAYSINSILSYDAEERIKASVSPFQY